MFGSILGKVLGGDESSDLGTAAGASAGALVACVIFNELGTQDEQEIKAVESSAAESDAQTTRSWKSDKGKEVTYSATPTSVKVKEYPETTCKQVSGDITVVEEDGDTTTANSEELYCQKEDGSWNEVNGTVL
jgi:hypothetical protein